MEERLTFQVFEDAAKKLMNGGTQPLKSPDELKKFFKSIPNEFSSSYDYVDDLCLPFYDNEGNIVLLLTGEALLEYLKQKEGHSQWARRKSNTHSTPVTGAVRR